MSMDHTIKRINELAKKAKTSGLTDEEITERTKLRQQYIDAVKVNFKAQLDAIQFVEEDKNNAGNANK